MNIWHICIFELRRILRIRSVLLNLFILPLLLIFILGTALSSTMGTAKEAIPDPVRVGIIQTEEDSGSGAISEALNTFVTSLAVSEMMKVQNIPTEKEAVSALRRGDLDFAVIVPSDLEEQIMKGEEARLQWILGKDGTLNVVGETLFTRFTDELNRQVAAAKVLGPDAVAAMSEHSQTNRTSSSYIAVSSPGEVGTSYSASQYYAASMLAMFMLYSGMTTSNSLFGERDKKTLTRLQAAPIGNGVIFAGKIAGNSLIAFLQAIIIVLATHWLYGVNWGTHPWLIVLICVLITLASMTLGVIVTLLFKNSASASAALQGIIIAMTFISGGFTPIAVGFVQRISEFTVNHWALQSFLRMMLNAPLSEIMYSIMMLGSVCAVMVAAAGLIYRKAGYRYE
ncbi:ABC-2 type transport system permease protein [Paenibacillus sp. OK060]|uniref:ABC transporter permease n=1 Tax=Paenibacillus sp. OK060 TaxID=1881034 RepID=UPI00089261D0|nr:ABC transporter permease [Paenibacillus sp. OK060]SDK86096.1 ABC-2 type transport system permease protein [Paenibacillus sp. OK060]